MELPSSIRFSSIVSDPEAYIQELFQLHPDSIHQEHFGKIDIKNEVIDSSFQYHLLEEGLFLFTFRSFSPIDAEYEFLPNPNAPYYSLILYFTENRSKNPLYLKLDEKHYSSDQVSLFFNGNINAEFHIKAQQKAFGLRLDIHQSWFEKNEIHLNPNSKSLFSDIITFKKNCFISVDCGEFQSSVSEVMQVLQCKNLEFKKLKLKSMVYPIICDYIQNKIAGEEQVSFTSKQSGILIEALNWMERNQSLTFPGTDFLAELCNISESSFNAKFKNSFNISASYYFKNLKMKKALNLLQLGHTVKEVAYKLEYKDVSSFGRSFKQIYGKSPAAFVKS